MHHVLETLEGPRREAPLVLASVAVSGSMVPPRLSGSAMFVMGRRWLIAMLLVATAGLASLAPAPKVAAVAAAASPIRHVVIFYQENLTFDALLGAFCEERATRCDGYTGPVTLADGPTVENRVMPDVVPGVGH